MDNNYRSYVEECGIQVEGEAIGDVNNWRSYDDMLKFSNCWKVKVSNLVVVGGKEDCIDACRGGEYEIRECSLFVMGKNGITVKCGVDGLEIENVEFVNRGHYSEIEIGMFSKYDRWPFNNPVENIRIGEVRREDGRRVRIWCWNAVKPVLTGKSKVWLIMVPKWIWVPYFLFRQMVCRFYG